MNAPFKPHTSNHSEKRSANRTFGNDEYSCKSDHVSDLRRVQIPGCVRNVRRLTNDRGFARRLHKFQHKLALGLITADDAMILTLDCLLDGKN